MVSPISSAFRAWVKTVCISTRAGAATGLRLHSFISEISFVLVSVVLYGVVLGQVLEDGLKGRCA